MYSVCCSLNVVGECGWVYALKDLAQIMNNSKQSCIVTLSRSICCASKSTYLVIELLCMVLDNRVLSLTFITKAKHPFVSIFQIC